MGVARHLLAQSLSKRMQRAVAVLVVVGAAALLALLYQQERLLLRHRPRQNLTAADSPFRDIEPLKPFVNGVSHVIFVEKYQLAMCMLPKVMSTITTAFFCYLNDHEAFKAANRTFANEIWFNRFCDDRIEKYNVTEFNERYNENGTYQLFTMVREPIDRFLAAFADKCFYEQKAYKVMNCYDCGFDLECVIDRMTVRFRDYAEGRLSELNYIDQHFVPQTWHCEMGAYLKNYTVFKYDQPQNPGFVTYKEGFRRILQQGQVPPDQVDEIMAALRTDRSPNSTRGKDAREIFEAELRNNRALMRKLVAIYFHDFLVFQFPFPENF